jgi:hypothetical protein
MRPSTTHKLLTALARTLVLPAHARRFAAFHHQLREAQSIQRRRLLDWLRYCRETRFGREHGFSEIHSVGDYRRRVPVGRYADFAADIDAVAAGQCNVLFPPRERVQRLTITTGSTGVPKLNPVTPTWLREYRKSWSLWGGRLLNDHREKVGTKIFQIIGSWNMGRTSGGLPISMVSALLARDQSPLVRAFYALPNEVTDISDPVARYYTSLRIGLVQDVGLIAAMNPGNLVRLAQIGDQHREALIRDIHDGTLTTRFPIPQDIRQALAGRVSRPDPVRSRELERIVDRTGHLYPCDYWCEPMIACWLGGTAGYQARYLPEYYGNGARRDQGLVSSEGRHTIPIQDEVAQGVLAINNGFYEFIPLAADGGDAGEALEGHELEIDRDYSLVMTTYSGYYRFRIGDIVRCRGFLGEAPLLEFLQKEDRCGDLEGEKVTEHQFLTAASEAALRLGILLSYVTAVPARDPAALPHYRVIVEQGEIANTALAERFLWETDQRLCASNFLYAARRREAVLGPPSLIRIAAGAWNNYVQQEIQRRGTGEAHYKHPGLIRDANWSQQFRLVDQISMPALMPSDSSPSQTEIQSPSLTGAPA